MNISVSQVDCWRKASSEHQRLEFKQARTQYSLDKAKEYCVAIANEGGGFLVLGVTDAPPRQVVGTAAFGNTSKITQKLHESLGFRVDVEEVDHPDGRVLVFRIPPRPKGSAYHMDGKYLMRSGASLVPMSEDRLRQILTESKTDWLEEYSQSGLDSQQVIELLDTQTYFELLDDPYPGSRAAVLRSLLDHQMVDQSGGSYAIRRIGALLLARNLNQFPDVKRKAPRVVVYTGISKNETRLDQQGQKGYAVGFKGLVGFVSDQLPQNEVIEDALRREEKLVPEIAVRELVANALIHQDFRRGGMSVMIEIFSNRLDITSPGGPAVPVDRFIDGYETRNERLAELMRMMRICEERSSGVDRVVEACEVFQLPAPDFVEQHNRTMARVFGPKPFKSMGKDDRVRACYQHCALRHVMAEHMTNTSLRERFNLSDSQASVASQIISATIDAGLIKQDQSIGLSRKYARYVPYWA